MAWDTKGRLWVAVWPTYPHWKPGDPMDDKLLIFEDTKGTGKADKCTVFADHLHCPTGFEFYNGGVLVAQAPDLMFLKDTKGTGKADMRMRLLHGLDSADSHHTSNSFTLDPGGALYFQEGHLPSRPRSKTPTVRRSAATTPASSATSRARRSSRFTSTYGFANPHGHVFDRWGQDIVIDGTGADPYHGALFSGQIDYPRSAPSRAAATVYNPTNPALSRHGDPFQPAFSRVECRATCWCANVIGFQGILRYKLSDDRGPVFGPGDRGEEPISSSNPPIRTSGPPT